MNYSEIFFSHFSWSYYELFGIFSIYIFATISALAIEVAFVGKANSTVYKLIKGEVSNSFRQDILVWAFEITGVWSFVGKIITLGLTYYVAINFNQWISSVSLFKFLPEVSSIPLQIIIYLMLADFVGYWLHRTFHKYHSLWMLHKFHHSANDMTVFNAVRDNPLVPALFVVFTGLPFAVFGAPSAVPFWISYFGLLHVFIIHSQLTSSWGWVGRWLIVSPGWHNIHHSKLKSHEDKNFSFLFPVWDHLFGTYYSGVDVVSEIGISDLDEDRSLFKQVFKDISAFVRLCLTRK